MTPLAVSGDVRLFVLGDGGVLFSEARQELYILNTAATVLWCLLEEGVTLDRLVDGYATTFGLSLPVAETHVYPMVRRWFGLGHLDDPEVPGPGQMSLSEALACLLTTPALRDRFRAAPEDVATALGVIPEDRELLVALDADALDQQALDIADQRSRHRHGVPSGAVSLDAADLLDAAIRATAPGETEQRWYRLVNTTFQIIASPALAQRIHQALVHLHVSAGPADVVLHVRESNGGCVVLDGSLPVAWQPTVAGLIPSLKLLIRRLAVSRERYFMEIHAGVVQLGDAVMILPGSAGHGKTTLTAALVHEGRYFSDEIALLEEQSLGVYPLPLAMTIKPGSIEPLRRLYPDIETLDEHVREDHQPVRYVPPPKGHCATDAIARPARWVVFPHYERGAQTVVTGLSAEQGLKRLLDESLVLPALLERQKVAALVEWARQVSFYDLHLSSLDEGVQAVRSIVSAS